MIVSSLVVCEFTVWWWCRWFGSKLHLFIQSDSQMPQTCPHKIISLLLMTAAEVNTWDPIHVINTTFWRNPPDYLILCIIHIFRSSVIRNNKKLTAKQSLNVWFVFKVWKLISLFKLDCKMWCLMLKQLCWKITDETS